MIQVTNKHLCKDINRPWKIKIMTILIILIKVRKNLAKLVI